MRGSMNRRDRGWRDRKRTMLRVMLFAAVPMMIASANADSPVATSQLLLPPLPLTGHAVAGTSGQQVNPFCQPAAVAEPSNMRAVDRTTTTLGQPRSIQGNAFALPTSSLRLASGSDSADGDSPIQEGDDDRTTVRLLPLNIEPQLDPLAAAPTGALTTGAVRSNPMVVVESLDQNMRQDTLHSVGHALPVAEPALAPVEALTTKPTSESKPVNPSLPTVAPEIEPKPSADAGPDESAATLGGPVSYSLDDENLVDTSIKSMETPKPVPETKPAPEIASLLKRDVSRSSMVARNGSMPVKGTFRLSNSTTSARDTEPSASIARGKGTARTVLVPLPPADDPSMLSKGTDSEARIVKGSRPRVDVGVPPVAIERASQSKSMDSTPVAQLTSAVTKPSDAMFESGSPTIVELKRTEVRALNVDGEIRKVHLANSSICAAIAAGSSQLQLIGAQDGVTRMTIWTASTEGKDNRNVYEIRVGSTSPNDASDISDVANTLTKSARVAFPDSNIRVRFEKSQMIVEGTCSSNDSAKQALRMIRSACLLPVVDKLTIR